MDPRPPRKPYTRLDPESFGRTLAQKLAGSRLTDPLRNLATRFGVRKYEVRLVRLRWSGEERYAGEPYLDGRFRESGDLMLLPTPRVLELGGINESVEGVGVQEIGQVVIDRISATYSEEDLRGLIRGEHEHPKEVEFFYEITFFGTDRTYRRRFNLATVPERQTLGWKLTLDRVAGQDRDMDTRNLPLSKRSEDSQEPS